MKILKVVALALCGVSLWAQPSVTWTNQSTESGQPTQFVGWMPVPYDALSDSALFYIGTNGIYSQEVFARSNSGHWTLIPNSGPGPSAGDTCSLDTASIPGVRHPSQMAVDTTRNVLWMAGGVQQHCTPTVNVSGTTVTNFSGVGFYDGLAGAWAGAQVTIGATSCTTLTPCTIVSVASGGATLTLNSCTGCSATGVAMTFVDGGNAGTRQDTYYMTLNRDPTFNAWHRVSVTPSQMSSNSADGGLVYDAAHDIVFHWPDSIYCPTLFSKTPGVLSALQVVGGCTVADDWKRATISGIPSRTFNTTLIYDPITQKIYQYAGANSNDTVTYNTIYSIDLPSLTATQVCSNCVTSSTANGGTPPLDPGNSSISMRPTIAYNSRRHTIWIHHFSGGTGTPSDWEYNPATDLISSMSDVTLGPDHGNGASMAYYPSNNSAVAWQTDATGGSNFVWTASLSNNSTLAAPITLQEALFAGDKTGSTMAANIVGGGGMDRNSEPFCMGFPVPDSAGITSTATLSLASLGPQQFRITGKWPSGNAKWVKACAVVPGMTAGNIQLTYLTNSGITGTSVGTMSLPNPSGGTPVSDTTGYGSGGANLATDNGSTITVATGAATFTVKKANFNGLDIVDVGTTHVVLTSTSATRGLVLMGPSPTATATITGTVAGPFTLTGSNDQVVLAAQGGDPVTVTLATGTGITATTIAGEINTASVPGLTASADGGGHLVLTSTVSGQSSVITEYYSPTFYATVGFPDPPNPSTATSISPGTSCSPKIGGSACTTVYSSANDSSSSCAIEENGPVRAVIRCIGNHLDGSGHPYMQYTMRETFSIGSTAVSSRVILRNANYNTAASPSADCRRNPNTTSCNGFSFNAAFKGLGSYELRIAPNISGTLNYSIATDSTPQTGTISSTDTAYVYQGTSNWEFPTASPDTGYCAPGTSYCSDKYTTDTGYVAKKNSTTLAGGDGNLDAAIEGWMDCANSSGVGISMGIDQMASEWATSLDCNASGADFRIGLFSSHNSQSVYMPWPLWHDFTAWMNFHAAAPASVKSDFWRFQYPLLARPAIDYVNSSSVFPYPILDPTTEDNYYVGQVSGGAGTATPASPSITLTHFCFNGATSNCTPDRGTQNDIGQLASGFALGNYRYYAWSAGGSLNQADFRRFDMMKFIQRGYTGRFLNSKNFYRYIGNCHWEHADGTTSSDSTINGFTWRSLTYPDQVEGLIAGRDVSNWGMNFCAGADGGMLWRDNLHDHWYGMTDFYFLTGDETVKEAIVPNKEYYLDTTTASYGTSSTANSGITRAFGTWMLATSTFALYSAAIGDSSGSSSLLTSGTHQFDSYVNVEACEGGIRPGGSTPTYYPAGCNIPLTNVGYVGGGVTGGTVDASGSFITWASGDHFSPTTMVVGAPININGTNYPVAAISSTTALTITGSVSGTGLSYQFGSPGWLPGMSFQRGNHQANSANNYCAWNTGTDSGMFGYYRIEQAFQQAILMDGILSLRRAKGATWTEYNRAADIAYGMALNNLAELWNDDATNSWNGNGFSYFRPLDFPVQCPSGTTNADSQLAGTGPFYDKAGLINGSQNIYPTFFTLAQTVGNSTWQRKFNLALQTGSTAVSAWLGDWGMPLISTNIYTLNHPPTTSLQPIGFTCNNCSGGTTSYSLTFTPPAGTCTNDPACLRVKWSPKTVTAINQLLGFDSLNTNTFTVDPATNQPWFSANNAELTGTVPTPTPASSQTITVVTGTTGLSSANFSVAAMFPAGCSISPTSAGPYTAGQVVSQTFTSSTCSSSTWSASGLTGSGLSIDSSTGVLSGTAAAGTYSATIAYDTASQPVTVVVNSAPSISTSSPLPSGTVSSVYSQTLAATGGTAPLSWTVSSGTVPTGLSLSSVGVLSGTPSTTSGSPFTFTAKATDSNSIFGTKSFSVTIGASTCSISPTSAGPYTSGQVVSSPTFTATGCTSSTWAASGLTGSGLTINSSTGVLSGTAVTGSYSATITYDTASAPMTIVVNASGAATKAPSVSSGIVFSGINHEK